MSDLTPTSTGSVPATGAADGRDRAPRLRALVVALPDRLMLILLAAAIAVSVAVAVRFFSPWLVVPVFVVCLVALWRFVPARPPRAALAATSVLIALVFVLGWIAFTAYYASELLDATRDPSLYTNVALWLTRHTDPGIDVSGAATAIGDIPGFTSALGVFQPDASDVVRMQGGATLPALLAVGGWVFGAKAVLVGNAVLGGAGLLSVFVLARRLLPPLLALAVLVALGLSIPMMFFSRSTYSETIMLAVCAAGLAWLIAGLREGRRGLWAVAGLFLGSASFARVDGALAVIGPAAVLTVCLFLLPRGERLDSMMRGIPWFLLFALLSASLGLGGLVVNQPEYLKALLSQVELLWGATAVLMLVLVMALVVRRRVPDAVLPARALKVIGIVAGIVVGGLFVFWLSRPLWMVSHSADGLAAASVAQWQKAEGLPIDPTRSYDEMTLSWVGWYFGWPMVVLAGIGLVVMIVVGIRRRRAPLLILAGATLAVALLYFTRISITPDQAWAYRRLLPIVTPGLLIAALYPLHLLWKAPRRRAWLRPVAVTAALLVAVVPLVTWNGLLRVADGRGESALVAGMCDQIHSDTVLFAGRGAPPYYAVPLRTQCGVNVVSDTPETTAAEYAEFAKRNPDATVIVFAEGALAGATDLPDASGGNTIYRWEQTLMRIPQQVNTGQVLFWLGSLNASGAFVAP